LGLSQSRNYNKYNNQNNNFNGETQAQQRHYEVDTKSTKRALQVLNETVTIGENILRETDRQGGSYYTLV
jgi:hypothetical protein